MRLRLRVGARNSPLSLWQARHAIAALTGRGIVAELLTLSSSGDRDRASPIEDLPGDAPFADDPQDALRSGEIDVAVHTLKDFRHRTVVGRPGGGRPRPRAAGGRGDAMTAASTPMAGARVWVTRPRDADEGSGS